MRSKLEKPPPTLGRKFGGFNKWALANCSGWFFLPFILLWLSHVGGWKNVFSAATVTWCLCWTFTKCVNPRWSEVCALIPSYFVCKILDICSIPDPDYGLWIILLSETILKFFKCGPPSFQNSNFSCTWAKII